MNVKDRPYVLVIGASERTEKITKPLSAVGINYGHIDYKSKSDIVSILNKIKTEDPDLVISDTLGTIGITLVASKILYSKPYVIRLRGDVNKEQEEWLKKYYKEKDMISAAKIFISRFILTNISMKGADGLLPVSDYLSRIYGDNGNSEVIHTPCLIMNDSDHNSKLNNTKLKQVERVDSEYNMLLSVMNMGFYSKVKGLIDGLEIISDVLDERGDTKLIILGDGEYYEEVLQASHRLSDHIELQGHISHVEPYYYNADALIHFSYLDAYPSTVLEAYSYRTPVLANRSVGMVEQIDNGETGYLVDLSKPDQVKSRLVDLLDSENVEMKENCYREVKKNNSIESIGKKFQLYINNFLHDKSTG